MRPEHNASAAAVSSVAAGILDADGSVAVLRVSGVQAVPGQTADEHGDCREHDEEDQKNDEPPFLHSKPLSMELPHRECGPLPARYASKGRANPSDG